MDEYEGKSWGKFDIELESGQQAFIYLFNNMQKLERILQGDYEDITSGNWIEFLQNKGLIG